MTVFDFTRVDAISTIRDASVGHDMSYGQIQQVNHCSFAFFTLQGYFHAFPLLIS